ncbi:MAG: helix-turn-helix transcriptional regulator [Gammaproteobacteria bacterium]|nr:helix-turn-helix transcriptional regulator [Gammaproteobacteria bacterium]
MLEDSDGFPLRLREAMQGRSIREFASSANMSAGTLHNYLNNESLPTLDKLIALANTADVNLNWLATGVGTPARSHSQTSMSYREYANAEKRLDIMLLRAIIECLEQTTMNRQIAMSAEKKSSIVASIYDLCSEIGDKAVNKEKITRLIESTLP